MTMNPDFYIGLQISLAGLLVTFMALGLLILLIRLLVWLFPVRVRAKGADEEERLREESAVALAVAVSLLENDDGPADRDPSLGKLLEK